MDDLILITCTGERTKENQGEGAIEQIGSLDKRLATLEVETEFQTSEGHCHEEVNSLACGVLSSLT